MSLGTSVSYSYALGREAWKTPPDRDVDVSHHLVPVAQTQTFVSSQSSNVQLDLEMHAENVEFFILEFVIMWYNLILTAP